MDTEIQVGPTGVVTLPMPTVRTTEVLVEAQA
jgi:hypothetical protein